MATTTNGCAAPVRCTQWTDVDREPRHVLELEPGAEQTLVFRRDAPYYGFRAYYSCQYRCGYQLGLPTRCSLRSRLPCRQSVPSCGCSINE